MSEFYAWAILLINQSVENGENCFGEFGRFPIANKMLCNTIKYFQRLLSEHTNLLFSALTESCFVYKK